MLISSEEPSLDFSDMATNAAKDTMGAKIRVSHADHQRLASMADSQLMEIGKVTKCHVPDQQLPKTP